jgi:hypothetical protein
MRAAVRAAVRAVSRAVGCVVDSTKMPCVSAFACAVACAVARAVGCAVGCAVGWGASGAAACWRAGGAGAALPRQRRRRGRRGRLRGAFGVSAGRRRGRVRAARGGCGALLRIALKTHCRRRRRGGASGLGLCAFASGVVASSASAPAGACSAHGGRGLVRLPPPSFLEAFSSSIAISLFIVISSFGCGGSRPNPRPP